MWTTIVNLIGGGVLTPLGKLTIFCLSLLLSKAPKIRVHSYAERVHRGLWLLNFVELKMKLVKRVVRMVLALTGFINTDLKLLFVQINRTTVTVH